MSVDVDQSTEPSRTSEPCPSYVPPHGEGYGIDNATKDHVSETIELSRETVDQARVAIPPSSLSADPRYELEDVSQDEPFHGSKERVHARDLNSRTSPAANTDPEQRPSQTTCQARVNSRKKIILLCFFYVLGLGTTLGHWSYYIHLNGTVVGDGIVQQRNIRVGTALAVLTQFSFVTAVWLSYTQSLWLNVRRTAMSPAALDAAFGADGCILPLLNTEMLRKFKSGSVLALLAWCLLLPGFFTPATLYVRQGTETQLIVQEVPHLAISNATEGHRFAYSPPTERNLTLYRGSSDLQKRRRTFAGPRTALTLASMATSAMGEILSLPAPHEHSSYDVSFSGPVVKCDMADDVTAEKIDTFLQEKMARPFGTAKEVDNAYYAFVPVWGEDGVLKPVSKLRDRGPSNGTNEVWITFSKYTNDKEADIGLSARERPRHRQRLVCKLFNATYDLSLSWERGAQTISGGTRLGEEIPFPTAEEAQLHDTPSDMARHAYSAFMWVLTDQLVGSMSWYEDEMQETTQPVRKHGKSRHKNHGKPDRAPALTSPLPAQFGGIDTQLEHNILLGCDDLDVFFDFSSRLYSLDDSSARGLKDQRQRDKDLGGKLSLGELIEQLSFNITVSLLQNKLLTHSANTTVTVVDEVNLYGYLPLGLFIPYSLANVFTLAAVIWGCVLLLRHGSMPNKSFSAIAMAARNPEIIANLEDRTGLLMAVDDGRSIVFQRYQDGGSSSTSAGGGTREKLDQGGHGRPGSQV